MRNVNRPRSAPLVSYARSRDSSPRDHPTNLFLVRAPCARGSPARVGTPRGQEEKKKETSATMPREIERYRSFYTSSRVADLLTIARTISTLKTSRKLSRVSASSRMPCKEYLAGGRGARSGETILEQCLFRIDACATNKRG